MPNLTPTPPPTTPSGSVEENHLHAFWRDGNPANCMTCGKTKEQLSYQSAYTLGRSSMKADILAVVPKDGENVHSVYTRCWDCLTWGINLPNEKDCGNCRSINTSEYWPDCRAQLLDNIKNLN